MKKEPTDEDRRLATIAAEVFRIPKESLTVQKILELAEAVREIFRRMTPENK